MSASIAMSGAERISLERVRQIEDEGWDPEHDDHHAKDQLAWAAVCYAAPTQVYRKEDRSRYIAFVDPWPWDGRWDKRGAGGNSMAVRVRRLEKAGALIAAEIDRLLRAYPNSTEGSGL